MLGVQINPMLDFRDHLQHITTKVRKLAWVLTKRRLSPNRKQLVIDQLLKPKYHAAHLGIFTDKHLSTIDKILNKARKGGKALPIISEDAPEPSRSAPEPKNKPAARKKAAPKPAAPEAPPLTCPAATRHRQRASPQRARAYPIELVYPPLRIFPLRV